MKTNFYNKDEEQFKEIIESLKSLPRAKAPSDFEFNLMTRIHNKNFKLKSTDRENFTIYGFLKPALSVSVLAVILFVVFSDYSPEVSDPLLSEPKLRQEIAETPDALPDKKEYFVTETNPTMPDQTIEKSVPSESEPEVEGYKVVLNENDVISKEKIDFPFEDKSIDLDATMRNNVANRPSSHGVLAGTGSNQFNFEGFYTRTLPDQKKLDSLRNLIDSIRIERNKQLRKLK